VGGLYAPYLHFYVKQTEQLPGDYAASVAMSKNVGF
jgi:hypothetical protein